MLLKYGSLKGIVKKIGIAAMVDSTISHFLDLFSKRFFRLNWMQYDFSDAVFHSKDIDRWSRYANILKEILDIKEKGFSIMEMGSGGQGIFEILSPKRSDLAFFLFDVQKGAFKGLKGAHYVIGDGCRLPFRDKAFDIIVSADAVEHIPKSIRHNFFEEAKRVARKKIILTFPMQTNDGEFQGRKYDFIFQSIYEEIHGTKETNTAQHIEAFHPTLEEIKFAFPGAIITGYKNANIWLKYKVVQSKPFIGLFAGVLYYLFWKKNDDKPPYWGAITVSNSKS